MQDTTQFIIEMHVKGIINLYDIVNSLTAPTDSQRLYSATFDELYNTWLTLVKIPRIKPITLATYKSVYRKHIKPTFSKLLVKNITLIQLQTYFNKLSIKSTRKAEDSKTIINGVLDFALANDIINKNPMKYCLVKKHYRINGTCLTPIEENTLLSAIKNKPYEMAILIYLYTGCRPSELNSIKFDFSNDTIKIRNSKLKEWQKNEFRIIPLFSTIKRFKPYLTGSQWHFKYDSIVRIFKTILPNHTLKDLRHTFTTKARQQGIDNELVNLWTGHTQGNNQTANTYTHFDMKFQQKQAKKIKY